MQLEPAPEIPAPGGRGWTGLLMMLPMAAGAAAMALLFSSNPGVGPIGYLVGGLFGVSMLGMVVVQLSSLGSGKSKRQMHELRREYVWDLDAARRVVRRTAHEQRHAEYYRHPTPDSLWALVDSARLWERRINDLDFCLVRVGLGPRGLATALSAGEPTPPERAEPVAAAALRRFLKTYQELPDLPVVLALNGFGRVYVTGDRSRGRAMVRALVAQVITFHAPDDLRIGICAGEAHREDWDWAKWLPHAQHPTSVDALGPLRLMSPSLVGLEAMLDSVVATRPRFDPNATQVRPGGPHVVIIIDDGDTAGADHLSAESGVEGVTIIDLSTEPPRNLDRANLVLRVDAAGTLTGRTFDGERPLGRADDVGPFSVEALAQQISPLRLATAGGDRAMNAEHGLTDLLGVGDPTTLDPSRTWVTRPTRDRLRVPIGIGPTGDPLELDLKESAQDGMGPHGLLIGATGSGKSELLRTLVLALAITHPPETLNFVLVDFKGGATFAKLDRLPQTSAVITNLADELHLVDRMTDAINGELVRRQELLRRAGNYTSQRDYERARMTGAPLAPLPSLFIVCDEFSELLSAKPDFIEMFVQIGRVGRSLGVHLLLASQRLEEGRLRGLDTHLSYRIGLRTFSPAESRTVLGANDAYELPRAPGHGFLRYGNEPLRRFRGAYVSGAYHGAEQAGSSLDELRVLEYVSSYVAPDTAPGSGDGAASGGDGTDEPTPDVPGAASLLDIVTERLHGQGVPAHQVWLPPLAQPPSLDGLLGGVKRDPARGLVAGALVPGGLSVPLSLVDKPFEQRRDVLVLDLAGAQGHVAVVGAPQTGKSTLLRTLLSSLALTHTPREVQVYCLDFGGGSLAAMASLPHVGGVGARHEVDRVRRTVAEVAGILSDRERYFADAAVDSMDTFRRRRAAGEFPDQPFGDVFLVIDGLLTIRGEFEDLEDRINDIANRGLSYGVHLVVAANRWYDVRAALRDAIGTRLELRLADPSDSVIDRRAAANVPATAPGRGITPDRHQCLTALPRIDGVESTVDLPGATQALVAAVRSAWSGPPAPAVRLLPERFDHRDLPQGPDEPGIAIGLAETDLRPVHVDLATADPHMLVFGDTESGKSNLLAVFAQALARRYRPDQAKIIALDYRRSLLDRLPDEFVIGYGTSGTDSQGMLADVATVMRQRLPGPEVTAEQLRTRSWWEGPDLYVIVDDYDLVATDRNPVQQLHDFLAQSREIGLHLIVARRSGGAIRAFFDPVLGRLRDLASPGLIMSGNREDGPILGNVKLGPLPAGRGWLVTRRHRPQLLQCGWVPDGH